MKIFLERIGIGYTRERKPLSEDWTIEMSVDHC
jgi:hypothetical protein